MAERRAFASVPTQSRIAWAAGAVNGAAREDARAAEHPRRHELLGTLAVKDVGGGRAALGATGPPHLR
jgi:hypothetical protein